MNAPHRNPYNAKAILTVALLAACVAGVTGCATALPSVGTGGTPQLKSNPSASGQQSVESMSCRDITGRMQLMILEIRGDSLASKEASFGQTLSAMFGKSEATPRSAFEAKRSRLEAYNNVLAVRNCKYFDLESELSNTNPDHTPTATLVGR